MNNERIDQIERFLGGAKNMKETEFLAEAFRLDDKTLRCLELLTLARIATALEGIESSQQDINCFVEGISGKLE